MAERKRTRTCESCKAASPTGSYINGIELFECRRRAPVPGDIKLKGRPAHWPIVQGEQWCMEYSTA